MISDNRHGSDIFHLEIDETAKASMLETARWSKFLTIVFFIFFGLLILGLVIVGVSIASVGPNTSQALGLLYGTIAIFLYVYPVYALFRFSTLLKTGIRTANQEIFNRALNYQKNMFKYMGILTIIGLVIYGLILVLLLVGVAASNL
ncbi:DUF5362 family protein [Taibaiella soli]|uniref:DUF5362 domain-containing protein n=1 Tax=Taibaiella soli TaxID=1649169 RepID=A0A2W2AM22_9BACT|nr:hypothetical protein [Taibaiella soli]PZF73350.1 hypothetical protein DN068_08135 [Taibaiella soli]